MSWTPEGERALHGAEWELFREGLDLSWEFQDLDPILNRKCIARKNSPESENAINWAIKQAADLLNGQVTFIHKLPAA